MSLRWHPAKGEVDVGALEREGLAPTFGQVDEAELWLGANFDALLDAGVTAVELRDGDQTVMGPMSLLPDH